MHLPLNALRAFEASARHLSLTRAALELHVTQTAVSQHIRKLEDHLGKPLFRRLPRGLALTDEGLALLPTLSDAFARMETALEQIRENRPREVLTVGVVGTFAVGWLLPRLRHFQQTHPFVDLRLLTHNNRVDMAGEGLDYAIRFGDGAWHGTHAQQIFQAPLSPMCTPGCPCCAATVPMSGRHGLRQRACPARCCGALCLTPPSPWPRLQRKAQGWHCCQWLCSRVSCNRGGWCSPLPWNCTGAPTG